MRTTRSFALNTFALHTSRTLTLHDHPSQGVTCSHVLCLGRFHPDVDCCFVPSERLADLALKCGMPAGKVRLHGLPIRPGFWVEQAAKPDLQRKLGLKPGVKACLIVGGGDGVGGLKGITDSMGFKLGKEATETQVKKGKANSRCRPEIYDFHKSSLPRHAFHVPSCSCCLRSPGGEFAARRKG